MNKIVHPNNPNHISILGIECMEGKIASQCMMIPVHEHQLKDRVLLSCCKNKLKKHFDCAYNYS